MLIEWLNEIKVMLESYGQKLNSSKRAVVICLYLEVAIVTIYVINLHRSLKCHLNFNLYINLPLGKCKLERLFLSLSG